MTVYRAILLTASEDNTIRVWGHPNRLKRESGTQFVYENACSCEISMTLCLTSVEPVSINTDSLATQGRMCIEEFLGVE